MTCLRCTKTGIIAHTDRPFNMLLPIVYLSQMAGTRLVLLGLKVEPIMTTTRTTIGNITSGTINGTPPRPPWAFPVILL